MATTGNQVGTLTEDCEQCGRATRHDVEVTILTESSGTENAQFSREPYRVSECRICGSTDRVRMNNA